MNLNVKNLIEKNKNILYWIAFFSSLLFFNINCNDWYDWYNWKENIVNIKFDWDTTEYKIDLNDPNIQMSNPAMYNPDEWINTKCLPIWNWNWFYVISRRYAEKHNLNN